WRLPDQTGAEVASTTLAGRSYLLWYYPKAMTPGCTAEGKALRDRYDELQVAGVEVLGVSFDPPKENSRFAAENELPFRLLTDDGSLAVLVGAASSSSEKTPQRISYLVGPDGMVRKAYASVDPASHADQVLKDARTIAVTQPRPTAVAP